MSVDHFYKEGLCILTRPAINACRLKRGVLHALGENPHNAETWNLVGAGISHMWERKEFNNTAPSLNYLDV